MKKQFVYFSVICFCAIGLMVSCGDGASTDSADRPSQEELKKAITEMEDSLKSLQANDKPIDNLHKLELVNRLVAFYQNYPKDAFAPQCLDKVHMIYSGMGVYERSSAYADTLLDGYPNYPNRAMILESQGSNYDIFIVPRDSAKVRYYYELLLEENPKMDTEKRNGLIDRLRFNHLSFDDYLNKRIGEMAI